MVRLFLASLLPSLLVLFFLGSIPWPGQPDVDVRSADPSALAAPQVVVRPLLAIGKSAPTPTAPVVITLRNGRMEPSDISVAVGQPVTWHNADGRDYALGFGDAFSTGTLEPGTRVTLTFDAAGAFPYACRLDPRTSGTVRVSPKG